MDLCALLNATKSKGAAPLLLISIIRLGEAAMRTHNARARLHFFLSTNSSVLDCDWGCVDSENSDQESVCGLQIKGARN